MNTPNESNTQANLSRVLEKIAEIEKNLLIVIISIAVSKSAMRKFLQASIENLRNLGFQTHI